MSWHTPSPHVRSARLGPRRHPRTASGLVLAWPDCVYTVGSSQRFGHAPSPRVRARTTDLSGLGVRDTGGGFLCPERGPLRLVVAFRNEGRGKFQRSANQARHQPTSAHVDKLESTKSGPTSAGLKCRPTAVRIRPKSTHGGPESAKIGPKSTTLGPHSAKFGPENAAFGQLGPDSAEVGRFGPQSTEFGATRTIFGPKYSFKCDGFRPNLARRHPDSGNFGPESSRLAQNTTESDQI